MAAEKESAVKEFEQEFNLLCSHEKLNRDKGYALLQAKLSNGDQLDSDLLQKFEETITKELRGDSSQWEVKFGSLEAAKLLVESKRIVGDFQEEVKYIALELLTHEEFRVRIAAGELLGALCKHVSPNVYKFCEKELVKSIKENLERHIPPDENKIDIEAIKDAKDIFHDTAGWKCLETSMKGLKCVIEGCQESFMLFLTQNLLDLIFETLKHTNRFVRETGYYVCSALVRYGVRSSSKFSDQIKDFGKQLALHLSEGLSDNWSQVRMAASVATREFFQDVTEEDRDQYYSLLLPPMCLNRYYLAEGVRLFNQQTWKQVVGEQGKELVGKHLKNVVEFYVSQTLSDNHAVREAACHCMAELASKIESEAVMPYVSTLLNALLVCFKDESWPVRDTACVACGSFVKSFPDECRSTMPELYPLFFNNLSDPIPSVRQGAAIALANIAQAYGAEAVDKIFETVKKGLTLVEKQQDNADRFASLEKGLTTYGVAKRIRANDDDLHTNQQMYSCGSLAPKMGRGGGGCSNHSFKRDSQPWEMTDGCIYALAELSTNKLAVKDVMECIPLLSKAASFRHYTQHFHLLETLCSKLPAIAEGIGKRTFKMYLETFFDAIFDSLGSDNQLTSAAAEDCLIKLSALLGQNIMRGRVENYHPHYVEQLDSVINKGKPWP
ncbi:uncharacterized protein LOC135686289 [Rhopilema esculentum]|uniref:uncharacterized protein LOC135686289 n=1 Tax=Rhopilema esculentum TaxID=499914 RepID=UPI0031DDE099|eukprot:gene609-10303_t